MQSEQVIPTDRIATSLQNDDVGDLRPGATNPWTSDESKPIIVVILANNPDENIQVGKVDIPNANSNVEEYVVYIMEEAQGPWVPLQYDDNSEPVVRKVYITSKFSTF